MLSIDRFFTKKNILTTLVVLVSTFLMVTAVVLSFGFYTKKYTQKDVLNFIKNFDYRSWRIGKELEQKTDRFPNLAIAGITIDWMNKQRKDDGTYFAVRECGNENCSEFKFENHPSWREGGLMIWGRYKYYERTKNKDDLNKLLKEVEQMQSSTLQVNSWHCRLLFDLMISKELDSYSRRMVYNLCKNSGYEVDVSNKVVTESMMEDVIDKFMNEKLKPTGNIPDDIKASFQKDSAFVSELSIAKLTQMQENISFPDGKSIPVLDVAKSHLFDSIYEYIVLPEKTKKEMAFLGMAALDIYRTRIEKKYLDLALFMENKSQVDNDRESLESLAYNLYFLRQLNIEQPTTARQKRIEFLEKRIIGLGFDYSGYTAEKYNIGAFGQDRVFSTPLNGLIVGLLSYE